MLAMTPSVSEGLRRRGRRLVQSGLRMLASRYNILLTKGLENPQDRVDHRIFMEGVRWWVTMDAVRNSALELISREVHERDISGAVAELGVFQGDFSALISHHFSDRKLYLFDTFEGFDREDVRIDQEFGYSSAPDDFSYTSVEMVRSKIGRTDDIEIRKGWFPESAAGCEETFCFASIDVDLYRPTREGLEWFYPRLSIGGYILVHDYNHAPYSGVKKAVREFAESTGAPYFAIPDLGGSAVFTKPGGTPP